MLNALGRVLHSALATAAGAVLLAGAGQATAECRWIVQPYLSEAVLKEGRPTYEILYDGLERRTFYAFTVTSEALAERLAAGGELPDLGDEARPLVAGLTPLDHTVYRLDPGTARPPAIYLVAAAMPVPDLDRLGARIVPARPVTVSQYVPRTRGATDQSGALPRRTEPTVVAEAGFATSGDLTICAYELAQR
ncbi:MAG TPA: hypothetical protein VFZ01_11255 [Geminicoccaceae bacterium]